MHARGGESERHACPPPFGPWRCGELGGEGGSGEVGRGDRSEGSGGHIAWG